MNPEGDMTGSAMSDRAPLFRGSPVRRVHVMVKPSGARCNLNCTYCYYLSKEQLLGKPDNWGISDELLEEFIHQYFASHNNKEVIFSWQGGEPTLLGLEFFRKVVALERDGSVYACDHYVCPEYRSGNIREKPLAEIAFSARQEMFGRMKEGALPGRCGSCDYQFTCFGEGPKNRFIKTAAGEAGLNYLCSGWKKFFAHIDGPVQKIVRSLGETVIKEVRTRADENWRTGKQS